jgi:hypothetical protein
MVYEGFAPIKRRWMSSEPDIILEIIKAVLRRLGYVESLPDDRTVKKVLEKRPRRKKFSWKAKKDIEN